MLSEGEDKFARASSIADDINGWREGIMGGLNGSAVDFNVTPDILKKKSEEVKNKVNQMKRHFEELQSGIDKMEGYWIGEAGDKHRQLYYGLKNDIEEILNRLYEHQKDLLTIAQNYMDIELSIEEDIEMLPGDVIV